jgi:hypothetical protein
MTFTLVVCSMVLLLVWLLLLAFLLDDQFKGLLQLFFFPQSSIVLVLWGSFAYDNTNLRSWLLVVKVKTMLIAASSFFNLHGRLCLLTSHLLLIYGYSYKYCVLVNYKWNNSRPRIFFCFGSLVFHDYHVPLRVWGKISFTKIVFLSFNLLFGFFRF